MATSNMETRNGGSPEIQAQEGNGEAPSGFILKLFQMVNGAPDEVITVSRKRRSSMYIYGPLSKYENQHPPHPQQTYPPRGVLYQIMDEKVPSTTREAQKSSLGNVL